MRRSTQLFLLVLLYNTFSLAITSMLLPGADRMFRYATLAGDGIVYALAATKLFSNRMFYPVKYYVLFLLCALLTFIYNYDKLGLPAHLNGLREPLFYLSTLVIVHDIFRSQQRERFVAFMTAFLIFLGIAELPFSLFQFLKYGAGDFVGGTYGTGGGSGLVSRLLFLIAFYLMAKYGSLDDGTNFSIPKAGLYSLLLLPCALNETKISFVFLAVYVVLLTLSWQKAYKMIPFLLVGGTLFFLLSYLYSTTVEDSSKLFSYDYLEKYLYSNPVGRKGGDLPRFARIPIMFRIVGGETGTFLLGIGFGVFQGGNVLGTPLLARKLEYLSGSRILFFSLWLQGGLLAVLVVGASMVTFLKSRLIDHLTLRRFKWFVLFNLFLVWVYDEAIYDRLFAVVIVYMMMWIAHGGVKGERFEEPLQTGSLASLEE